MNRAESRRAARAAKHKPNRSAARYITPAQLEFDSFDSIDRLFQKLRHGELEWGANGWVIMGLSGASLHILSALDGWLEYWSTLALQQSIAYNDVPLRRLAKSLEYNKPLTEAEVDAAQRVVDQQRLMYRTLPKSITTAVSKQVQATIRRDNEIGDLARGLA